MDPTVASAGIGAIGSIGGSIAGGLFGKKDPRAGIVAEQRRNASQKSDLNYIFALKRLMDIDPNLARGVILTGGKGGNATKTFLEQSGGRAFFDPDQYNVSQSAYARPQYGFFENGYDPDAAMAGKQQMYRGPGQPMGANNPNAKFGDGYRYKGFNVENREDLAAIDAMNAMFGAPRQMNNMYGYNRPQTGFNVDYSIPTQAGTGAGFGYGGGSFGSPSPGYSGNLMKSKNSFRR